MALARQGSTANPAMLLTVPQQVQISQYTYQLLTKPQQAKFAQVMMQYLPNVANMSTPPTRLNY